MNEIIKSILGTSPRTTILGGLMAVIAAIVPFVDPKYQKICAIALSVLGALYARVSKDSNGITAKQSKVVAKIATDGLIPPTNDDSTAI